MVQLQLSTQPEEATKNLLKKLTSRRMRDVLEKRFGLKGGHKKTLEGIGQEYKITRERVRQIETDALRHLGRPENIQEVEPVLKNLEGHFKEHGEVLAEPHIFTSLVNARQIPHVTFLLHVGKAFSAHPETVSFHRRWTTNKNAVISASKVIDAVVADLDEAGHPVSLEELNDLIDRKATAVGVNLSPKVRDALLAASKLIRQNPYGEYGLISWATINPRGVKDKAYLVLAKSGKPMHFREVAGAINSASWTKRKAHPQTVHNELIKDSRFVLVGRGLYALNEWGYQPGTVRDVLVSVFKEAGKPLIKDEVIQLVLEKRMVKPPTILLNLQNKSYFKRTEGGKYTLV